MTYGQININIPEANIRNRTEYQQEFPAGQYGALLNLLPTISTKANRPSFDKTVGDGPEGPLDLARISIVSIGNISLIGTSAEVILTTGYQELTASVANLLPGPVTANARLNVAGHTWTAGTYNTELAFLAPALLGGNVMNPATHVFNINIPAFITPQTEVGITQLLVNDLSFYRTTSGASADKVISLSSTVPHIPSLQTANAQFNFSTSSAYNALPTSPVNTVNASLTGVPSSTSISLSTTSQNLTGASGIDVPTNNTGTISYNYSINAAALKESFVQAGTYSVPLTYSWNKPITAYPPGALQVQRAGTLEVIVSDLAELVANQNMVDLAFTSTDDYQTGVVKDMPAHLQISKTTPYNLYVRASSADFSSGVNSIPLDVLRIGPMTGETGMNTVTLSTTPQQLIDSADPVIDRMLDLRYSIPAAETSKLLNKPAGTYSTDIVFSFVAP